LALPIFFPPNLADVVPEVPESVHELGHHKQDKKWE
jgi:hypothetical protein